MISFSQVLWKSSRGYSDADPSQQVGFAEAESAGQTAATTEPIEEPAASPEDFLGELQAHAAAAFARATATAPTQVAVATKAAVVADLQHVQAQYAQLDRGVRLAIFEDPLGLGADRFRFLRMRLTELKSLSKMKTLVITSPVSQDGKSTVILNLATALSEGGKARVLVIDADLRYPTMAKKLVIEPRPGLSECLEDDLDPLSLIEKVDPLSFYLLHAGIPKTTPTALLQSPVLSRILESLAPHFDWVLIDTPPIVPLIDAGLIARVTDGCLLVVRAEHTPDDAVERAISALGPKRTVGIVFNAVEGLNKLYSSYYYGN